MMKPSSSWVLAGALVQLASGVVHLPFVKQPRALASNRDADAGLDRRSLTSGLSLQDTVYAVNVTVGTPGQPMTLQVSPLAAVTWVVDARSSYCSESYYIYTSSDEDDDELTTIENCIWGTFGPGNSSTFVSADPNTESSYDYSFDGTTDGGDYVYGDYFSDVLTIDDSTIPSLTMGLVNDTDAYYGFGATYMGVLGIGYNDSINNNLPNHLFDQGLINSTAYSMWVDDEAATSGSLLFGAIDTSKFDGHLTRLAVEYTYYMPSVIVASINGSTSTSGGLVSITASDDADDDYSTEGYASYLFGALYSPSETLSLLPSDVANQIWTLAGATYNSTYEAAVIDCGAVSDNTTFTFQLGARDSLAPILTAYMSDLVLPISEVNLTAATSYYYSYGEDLINDTSNLCLFGIQNSSYQGWYYSLGSSVLRRTYSVIDLANYEVAVAPVKFGATETSTIVPFASSGAAVPSATVVCDYTSCSTNLASVDNDGPSGISDGSDTTGLSGVLSLGAILGISFGIAAFFLIAGFIAFIFWRRHAKKKATAAAAAGVNPESGNTQGQAANASAAAIREAAPEMSGASSGPEVAAAAPAAEAAEPSTAVDKGKAPEHAPAVEEPEASGSSQTAEQHSEAAEASTANAGKNAADDHVATRS
ncbi:aspartic peptidase domain-containing protein [Coniella lustricola]|uniref:Aspartic peptidase domain-containing protein n=1 Tax=Coniella lustricola TaxID=2025994 RepID=A0A2T3AA19_9PEZI|nr:aspartic peptidase domain-containing protein [Coniella lustricola]